MKITDSFVRRGIFNKAAKSKIHKDFGKYYPIVCWSNKDCLSYISIHNLPKPLKLGSKRPSSGVNLRKRPCSTSRNTIPSTIRKSSRTTH